MGHITILREIVFAHADDILVFSVGSAVFKELLDKDGFAPPPLKHTGTRKGRVFTPIHANVVTCGKPAELPGELSILLEQLCFGVLFTPESIRNIPRFAMRIADTSPVLFPLRRADARFILESVFSKWHPAVGFRGSPDLTENLFLVHGRALQSLIPNP
jgi:hypothetical protein